MARRQADGGSEDRRGAAFFDYDNTLIHGDAGPLFGAWLYRLRRKEIKEEGNKRLRRLRLWARYAPFVTWMGVQGGLYELNARRRSSLVRSAYKGLRGIPAQAFYDQVDAFVDQEIPPRIYPELVQEIERHQAAGRRCIIITTGIEHLVQQSLRHFPDGVEVIGCRLQEHNGTLTGKVEGPLYGADKQNIIRAYCRAAGIDPADCWAYTDHYSDFHMLLEAGNGVCVNPRGKLEQMARRKGWTILRPDDPRKRA